MSNLNEPRKIALAVAGFAMATGASAYFLAPKWFVQTAVSPAPQSLNIAAIPTSPDATVRVRMRARAPDFEAPLLRATGGKLKLSDLRGKAVVMNFWASWCGPCRAEARDLEATYQRYKAQGVVFLGVDIVQDTWEDALDFVQVFGITYPTVRDGSGKITATYQIVNLPTTYFIDREGIIQEKHLGGFLGEPGRQELLKRIEALLR